MKVITQILIMSFLSMTLFFTGCASNPAQVVTPGDNRAAEITSNVDAKIKAGDSVRVNVYGHEDLSGEFEVDNSGNIAMPLIRQVAAAGLTTTELESEITRLLQPDYLKNPSVSIELLNQSPVYITGEVRQPGQFPYRTNMTVFAVAALAGGYTYRAKNNIAYIIRAGDKSRAKEKATPETLVYPGDIIEIPERLF